MAGYEKSPSKNPRTLRDPTGQGFKKYDDIVVETKDGKKLRGWHIPTEENPQRLIVYFQ